jgi:hypothetical protein
MYNLDISTSTLEVGRIHPKTNSVISPGRIMVQVRDELIHRGIPVGMALYEKCLSGSGIYPLGTDRVVKAELADDVRHVSRLEREGRYMLRMAEHAIGPKIERMGSFETGDEGVVVYIIMERYTADFGTLSSLRPPTSFNLLDHTTGWMINNLFRRTAYRARMLLTDLKPHNIVANLDCSDHARISSVAFIDFSPEYCGPLAVNTVARTAYLSMLLLYSAISTSLGFQRCAQIISPYITRRRPDELQTSVEWMETQPSILKAMLQYTCYQKAADLYEAFNTNQEESQVR